VPVGYLLVRIFRKQDIRSVGSGNIGATNVLRSGGKVLGAATFVLDVVKGAAAVLLGTVLAAPLLPGLPQRNVEALAALCAVIGHMFPVWLGFKGGKGVATSFGAIFALSWQAGCVAAGGWIAGALLTQYSSVGSMFGSVLAPVALWFFTGSLAETLYGVLAALLIVFTHRENIARLRAGTEGPISFLKRK
jgi:glycerol-3-phosphate acyltransferase PlsY